MVADMAEDNAKATPLGKAREAANKSHRRAIEAEAKLAKLEAERKADAVAEAAAEKTAAEAETKQQQKAKPNYNIDPAMADPWDLTPEQRAAAARQVDPNDPLAPFREGKGHSLEIPSSVMNFSEEDSANLSDFGFVAAREGWSKQFAQAIVDQAAAEFRMEKSRPGPEGYDPERTVSELRFEWGADTESILMGIGEYCAKRPALSAYLDATGLGNSPAVIRMLAAVAKDESLITKAGAQRFIDSLGKNEKYWNGDKLELAKAKIAFQIADAK